MWCGGGESARLSPQNCSKKVADLNQLHPALVPWAKYLYAYGKQNDGRLVVTSTKRTPGKQFELYQRWLSGRSKIPANRPGTSLHELGWAFDMARLGIDPLDDALLNWLGAVWEHWGGRWGGSRDPVHFQIRV